MTDTLTKIKDVVKIPSPLKEKIHVSGDSLKNFMSTAFIVLLELHEDDSRTLEV